MGKSTSSEAASTLLQALSKSGLLGEDSLQEARQQLQQGDSPPEVAKRLVAAGRLTAWQARQLLRGFHSLQLGNYKLLELTDKTQWGRTFAAEHGKLGRRVSLTALSSSGSERPEKVDAFLADARAAARLDHRNLAHVYDVDQDGERLFVITERIEGHSLRQMVAEGSPLAPLEAAGIIRQAAAGLEHAHEHGLVHADLHPGNLVVDPEGVLKIVNIGFRSVANEDAEGEGFVEEGERRGTPEGDVYSLGCLLHYALTGSPPDAQSLDKLPPQLAKVCKAVMQDPARRPTAAKVASHLGKWLDKEVAGAAAAAESPVIRVGDAADKPAAGEAPVIRVGDAADKPAAAAPAINVQTGGEAAPPGPKSAGKAAKSAGKAAKSAQSAGKAAQPAGKAAQPAAEVPDEVTSPAAGSPHAESSDAASPAAGAATGAAPAPPLGSSQKTWWIVGAAAAGLLLVVGATVGVMMMMSSGDDPQVAQADPADGDGSPQDDGGDSAASDPAASDPAASDPASSDPAASDPASSDPAASDPASSDPAASDPAASDPAASDPAAGDPAAGDPAAGDPAAGDPAAADPAATDPAAADPAAAAPGATDPATPDAAASPDTPPSDPNGSGPAASPDSAPDDPPADNPPADNPPPQKNPPQKGPPPKPEPPADPYAGFPTVQTLPPIEAGQSKVLGKLHLDEEQLCFVKLRGGDNVLPRSKVAFSVRPGDGGTALRDWDLFLEGDSGKQVAARLSHRGGELKFQWEEAATADPAVAAGLQNCMLSLSIAGEESHLCALREPVKGDPLALRLDQSTSVRWMLDGLPDPTRLHLQLVSIDGLPKFTVEPEGSLAVNKGTATIKIGEAGEQLLELSLETKMRGSSVEVEATPFLRLGNRKQAINKTTMTKLAKQLDLNIKQAELLLKQMVAAKAQGGQRNAGLDQKMSLLQQELEKAKAALTQVQKLEGLASQDFAAHFAVYADAGISRIDVMATK